ncbi:hypothetical protein [Halobacterium yunchengense]|uniref:hypothetical protein n=1 Tax=Halobacterium yunchengense TaxID=3108497 RepID=UPI00300B2F21
MDPLLAPTTIVTAAAAGGQTGVVDPSAVAAAPAAVRAVAAFCLVAVVGGLLRWRAADVVDRAQATWTDSVLASLAYGLSTHAVLVFAGVYLANKFSTYRLFGGASGDAGLAFAVVLVGVAAALGFTVVGSTVADLAVGATATQGLLAGAAGAAALAAAPLSVGAVVWFGVVSLGIGGAVREWVHASVDAEPVAESSS